MKQRYFIQTFGCQQNVADSERIESQLQNRGMVKASSIDTANHVVINTCMIKQMAENRVYGLVNNLGKKKKQGKKIKIVITGCMVGMAARDKTGKFLKVIRDRMPAADEFLPIEEVGFDHDPIRTNNIHGWVPISNGCNNFCTFCVVPFTRGRELSRPYADILHECYDLVKKGYKKITLLGMNVNSYGADLIVGAENVQVLRDIDKSYFKFDTHSTLKSGPKDTNVLKQVQRGESQKGYKLPDGKVVMPVFVKHLNRLRIPTLFPYLLEDIANLEGLEKLEFMSSNPWDMSDEVIDVIARHKNISRLIHFALQSGSDTVLKRMNRWHTREDYLKLLKKMREKIPGIEFSTDLIVGFCGETDEEFAETVALVKEAKFLKAYISMYSDRPMTAAHKAFKDDVPYIVKKQRWNTLENLINKPNLPRIKTFHG
jgi:tRNA-2-methylthio-N6-dimethylallyladenosine synthase